MAITINATARAKFQVARELAFGDITSSFKRIGDKFDISFGILYVQNFTDVIIDFSVSFEGTDLTFSLAPQGILATDMITNGLQVSAGESAWCKYRSGAPTSGFVQVAAVSSAT